MAQPYPSRYKPDRCGCYAVVSFDLLHHCRAQRPRFCWEQDAGGARCCPNDCMRRVLKMALKRGVSLVEAFLRNQNQGGKD